MPFINKGKTYNNKTYCHFFQYFTVSIRLQSPSVLGRCEPFEFVYLINSELFNNVNVCSVFYSHYSQSLLNSSCKWQLQDNGKFYNTVWRDLIQFVLFRWIWPLECFFLFAPNSLRTTVAAASWLPTPWPCVECVFAVFVWQISQKVRQFVIFLHIPLLLF